MLTVTATRGIVALIIQHVGTATSTVETAMPYLSNGCQTMIQNLSRAIKKVDIVDISIESIIRKLKILQ
jgi:hypothetical protein